MQNNYMIYVDMAKKIVQSYLDIWYVPYAIMGTFFLLFLIYFFRLGGQKKKRKFLEEKVKMIEKVMFSIRQDMSLEKNLDSILSIIAELIKVQGYYFYIFDKKKEGYFLTAIRNTATDSGAASLNSAGKAGSGKETFTAPNIFEQNLIPKDVSMIKLGEVPMLVMPIPGGYGIICIGPIPRVMKIKKRTKNLLMELEKNLQPILNVLVDKEEMKNKVDIVLSSSRAVQNVQNSFNDYENILNTISGISIKTVSASGGFVMKKEEDGTYTFPVLIGFEKDIQDALVGDHESHKILEQLLGNKEYVVAESGEKNYYVFPSYLAPLNANSYFITSIDSGNVRGMAVYWFGTNVSIEKYKITAMVMMAKRIGDILNNFIVFRELSNSYMNILKVLSQTLNNMSPFTVGYSELMYRYSYVIAKKLGIASKDAEEIAIAAYLCNIGVIGLSDNLFLKKGKYSEVEFELMKLHSDVGASIVEATIGNKNIAKYIRYHHERIDGFGYPERLKDEEIPMGSKILAVVQTFLAKLNGREGRDPLSFNKSFDLLISASGSQLDEKVVQAMIDWYKGKQKNQQTDGKALGKCWDMRCSPTSICGQCPAYKNQEMNCWEQETNNCEAHGNVCETCFIRTEITGRESVRN